MVVPSPSELAISERNLFLTGAAGTGKSYLLGEMKPYLPKNTYICSTTGVSALLIEGCTLHKLIGLGLCLGSVDSLHDRIAKNKTLSEQWRTMHTLIIDEISMCDIGLFVKVSAVMSKLRRDTRPWGGIRLVLLGDFLQLPPIQIYREDHEDGTYHLYKHLFSHPLWSELNLQVIHLTEPKRYTMNTMSDNYEENMEYAAILSDVRMGILSDRVQKFLRDRTQPPIPIVIDKEKKLRIVPTVLIATNKEVDSYNNEKLDKLPGKEYRYDPVYTTASANPLITRDEMVKLSQTPDPLRLKIGAQVMLLLNRMDDGLANGSRGVVIAIGDDERTHMALPIVRFLNGKTLMIEPHTWSMSTKRLADGTKSDKVVDRASLKQLPLKLAWATTIHKSQGASLDAVYLSMSSCFAPSHLYVALSRCRNRNALFLHGYSEDVFKRCMPDRECIEFYQQLPHD